MNLTFLIWSIFFIVSLINISSSNGLFAAKNLIIGIGSILVASINYLNIPFEQKLVDFMWPASEPMLFAAYDTFDSITEMGSAYKLYKLPPVNKWQEYEDNQLGLSFRYPPSWDVTIGRQNTELQKVICINGGHRHHPGDTDTNCRGIAGGLLIESDTSNDFREELMTLANIKTIVSKTKPRKVIINNLTLTRVIVDTNDLPTYIYMDGDTSIKFTLYPLWDHSALLDHAWAQVLGKVMSTMKMIEKPVLP